MRWARVCDGYVKNTFRASSTDICEENSCRTTEAETGRAQGPANNQLEDAPWEKPRSMIALRKTLSHAPAVRCRERLGGLLKYYEREAAWRRGRDSVSCVAISHIYKDVCGLAQAKGLLSLIYHEPVLEVRFTRGVAGTTRILTIVCCRSTRRRSSP